MNTGKSDQKVQEMRVHGPRYLRGVIFHSRIFQTTPDKLFPLLCPTTEFDWMEGWHCELVYSKSLYAEYNAIFKTSYFNMEEIWVVSHFKPKK